MQVSGANGVPKPKNSATAYMWNNTEKNKITAKGVKYLGINGWKGLEGLQLGIVGSIRQQLGRGRGVRGYRQN